MNNVDIKKKFFEGTVGYTEPSHNKTFLKLENNYYVNINNVMFVTRDHAYDSYSKFMVTFINEFGEYDKAFLNNLETYSLEEIGEY